MTLSIIERKGLYVVDSESLSGDAGDAINDNFYEIGDQLETYSGNITDLQIITGTLDSGINDLEIATGLLKDSIDELQLLTGDFSLYAPLAGNITWEDTNSFNSGVNIGGNLITSGDIEYTNTFWDDLRVPVVSTKLVGSKDPQFTKVFSSGTSQGVFTYLFDKTTEEELYFAVQLPHSWKEGTNIHPHTHWFPIQNGATGAKVGWGLEYTWASIGEVFGTTTLIYGNQHVPTGDVVLAQNKHYLTEIGEINGSGKTFSSMLLCRVFRDAGSVGTTDDYDDDVGLIEIDFHYEIDSPGTSDEYIK